jgi:selenocysteine lyase/cysteine desulfurase
MNSEGFVSSISLHLLHMLILICILKTRLEKLDAIYFSPHKFLGGPGSSGVLIFDVSLYNSEIPDDSGGGTVDWTNPWGKYKYVDNIEVREDGGTPDFCRRFGQLLP